MNAQTLNVEALTFELLTPDRWPDLERLFGPRGAVGGCWCMWPRLSSAEFDRQKGAANREALREIVNHGPPPGILAYEGDTPVGWCSFAPRRDYGRLSRSRTLKAVDDLDVWSIGCFFIPKGRQGRGLSLALLRAAVAAIEGLGGRVIEGYPHDPQQPDMPTVFAWTGFVSTFLNAGFVEVARRSPTRPIMRYVVKS